ncbi:FKBP-type peptidyl-prolyl cis-trans isomerase [Sphingomonas canadensis]|uniref:Peptidyl-prolyl cis-trans isomerase n=1 Tax=Sphingomonas canadensis TaxID=1219257 RepID=A0ABW3H9B4_9SPHN|nr:FKBP-type peptidyl-prolyl cis-trans isomerase [Sphingomonas canadensis]MCW3837055.1 FKBP-type peptidyl-prolyl cis-trans isomerase [Sphingomonas canadensis]
MIRTTLAALTLAAIPAAAPAAHAQDAAVPPVPATAQDSAWHNRQILAVVGLKWQDGWRWLDRMRWRRVAGDGSGAHPKVSDTVTVHYEGTLTDGTKFDSSWDRGEPATFPLERLIKAWQLAIPMAGVGDTIEIAIPADLGYGPKGKGPIPGNATLLFKIQLLGIETAE